MDFLSNVQALTSNKHSDLKQSPQQSNINQSSLKQSKFNQSSQQSNLQQPTLKQPNIQQPPNLKQSSPQHSKLKPNKEPMSNFLRPFLPEPTPSKSARSQRFSAHKPPQQQSILNLSQDDRHQQHRKMMYNEHESQSGQDSKQYEKEIKLVELSQQELEMRQKAVERVWEYRYCRLVDYAIETRDWFKVFSFLGEFKEKCIQVLTDLVNHGLDKVQQIEEVSYYYSFKGNGEIGIYLVDGIIIRIAKLKRCQNGQFDDTAVKVLHQQQLSNNILNNLLITLRSDSNLPPVRVPVSCLVKYMGYTAFCQASNPCDGFETLVSGPSGSVYQERNKYTPLLDTIGDHLNLKPFTTYSGEGQALYIPFCFAIELHEIKKLPITDNLLSYISEDSALHPGTNSVILDQPNYYIMKCSKLWPLFIDNDISKSTGYVRPEMVISWKTKLSNAIFSEIKLDKGPEMELELADACKNLKEENIKKLAKMLDDTTVFIFESQGIEEIMHDYGINMRYLGSLATIVNLEFNQKTFETEMIARVCKRYFFTTLQKSLSRKKSSQDLVSFVKEFLVYFLNLLFVNNQESKKFHLNFIYKEIERYYKYKMEEYPPELKGGGILHAICYHFGVRIKIIDYPFYQEKEKESIFNISHVMDIVGFAKTFNLDTCELKQLTKRYKQKKRQNKLEQTARQLRILCTINKLLNHEKTFNIGTLPQAFYYAELSEVYFAMKEYAKSRIACEDSLRGIPEKHADAVKPYGTLIKFFNTRKEMTRCNEFYEKALINLNYHLVQNHPLSILVYNTLGYEFVETTELAKCEKIFLKSFQICEQALGYMHQTSGEILLQLASLPLPPQRAINFYLQALTVLENLSDDKDKIMDIRKKIADKYEETGHISKMLYYARRSNYWEKEIVGEDKLNEHLNVLRLTYRVPENHKETKFLLKYCFKSCVILMNRNAKSNLYKLFVSIEDKKLDSDPLELFHQRLTREKTNSFAVTEYVQLCLNHLIAQLPHLIDKQKFYRNIEAEFNDNRNLKNFFDAFIEMIMIIGTQEAEDIFLIEKKIL